MANIPYPNNYDDSFMNVFKRVIDELNTMGYTYEESLQKAQDILKEAQQTNDMNKAVDERLDNIIADSGTSSTEVVDARGKFDILKHRMDSIDRNFSDRGYNIKNPPAPLVAAVGDGVADDYGAIQGISNHVANEGGGVVHIPDGDFNISDSVNLSGGNITFIGNGYNSHIHTTNDVNAFVSSGNDNLNWFLIRVTGTRTGTAYNGYGSGINVSNANNVRVEFCTFKDLMAKAVFYNGFHSLFGGNVEQGVHDGWVQNNYIDNCGDGVMVYNDGQRVEVSRNMIFRCMNIGIYIDDSHQPDGEEIPRKSTRINVENNYLEDMMGTTAINLAGTDFSAARGNYILYGGQSVQKNVNGISLQTVQNHIPTENNIVEGNTIVGNTGIAIDLIGASKNIIRNNNMINNSLNRPSGNAPSIQLRSTIIRDVGFGSDNNIIENNKSLSDDPNSNTPAHVIIDDADCVDNIIRYNVFDGGVHYEWLVDRGTGTLTKDNIFNGVMDIQGFKDGDKTEPSIYFESEPSTGFYRLSNGDLGFAFGGEWIMRFRDGMQFNDGTAIQFGTNTGTKFGSSPTQKMAFWGVTPKEQPENIPQTSGATLVELEQEVNKLKLMLEKIGFMAE